jgi:outer membrane lipoprotein carrier protein
LGKLGETFKIREACTNEDGTVFELEPKSTDSTLESFRLLVDSAKFTPIGAKILDAGGNETSILLVGSKFNTSMDATRFSFQIPRGIDVIDQRSADPSTASIKEETLSARAGKE